MSTLNIIGNVESILEEKFHDEKGKVGKIFGVDITTRFSKEALLGIIAIQGYQMQKERDFQKMGHRIMPFLR
jgi:hypothetical protein